MQLLTFISCLLSISIAICSAATSRYDGKPGCKTPGEVGQLYRNFWDPMRLWRCIGLNMEPLQENCPDGTGFQQSLGRCVSWKVWKWETPQYPPSCPDGVTCLSTELRPMITGTYPPQSFLPSQSETLVPAWPLPQSPSIVQTQALLGPQPLQQLPMWPLPLSQPQLPTRPLMPLQPSQVWEASRPLSSLRPLSPHDSLI